ncbi:hypothetical protein [Streptomyces lancefieldiae]
MRAELPLMTGYAEDVRIAAEAGDGHPVDALADRTRPDVVCRAS